MNILAIVGLILGSVALFSVFIGYMENRRVKFESTRRKLERSSSQIGRTTLSGIILFRGHFDGVETRIVRRGSIYCLERLYPGRTSVQTFATLVEAHIALAAARRNNNAAYARYHLDRGGNETTASATRELLGLAPTTQQVVSYATIEEKQKPPEPPKEARKRVRKIVLRR